MDEKLTSLADRVPGLPSTDQALHFCRSSVKPLELAPNEHAYCMALNSH
jgi:hypothetical protein